MLKNKFRLLVFVLIICVSVTSSFARETKIEKTVSKANSIEQNLTDSPKLFELNSSNKIFWTLSNKSFLTNSVDNQIGEVTYFVCYALCRASGAGGARYCNAICSITL